eukprot:gene11146-13654_t
MPSISPLILASLQDKTQNIRNICVLAHVDHGKTTLSDCLISSNGIISPQMAGKLRYLDFMQDEQEREITMKASSISLLFQKPFPITNTTDQQPQMESFLINLIDSPGHVDFSSEVSTAVRITDGALLLVDAVEGVCIQTHAVLKQAYQEKVRPCLVINKIDRLIGELHMTPLEAYQHIKKILEQVNAVTGTLSSEEVLLKESEKPTPSPTNDNSTSDTVELNNENTDEEIGSDFIFSPEKGNVAFTTAFDGWGFTIKQFVDLCHKKTGIKKVILEKTLWGEYYYHPKEKKIYKSQKGNLSPMFVTFILNSIWEVYKTINVENVEMMDKEKLDKMITMLKLNVPPRDLASKDTKIILRSVLQTWLPLSDAVLEMVCDKLPNPMEAQQKRMDNIFKPMKSAQVSKELEEKQQLLFKDTLNCNSSDDSEIVAYVAKVFSYGQHGVSAVVHRPVPPRRIQPSAVPKSQQSSTTTTTTTSTTTDQSNSSPTTTTTDSTSQPLPTVNPNQSIFKPTVVRPEEKESFVGLVRVFSGTLRIGKKIYILGPRFDPLNPTHDITEIEITKLYLLMGSSLEPIDKVPAGNVCGVGGSLGRIVLKSATLSTSLMCPPLANMQFLSSPIVKVAVEPENITEMPKLVEGLRLLNQADPLVEVLVQETGEHVIVATGELHLERCIRELKETFAKINIHISPPIVPFRETIVQNADQSKSPILNETISAKTANKKVTIKMKAIPLPKNVTNFIEQHSVVLRDLFLGGKKADKELNSAHGAKTSKKEAEVSEREEFQKQLQEEFIKAGGQWANEINNIWSFGPKHIGSNILLNHIPGYSESQYWRHSLQRGIQKSFRLKKVDTELNNEKENENQDEEIVEKLINVNVNSDDQQDEQEEEKEIENSVDEDTSISSSTYKLLEGDEKFKKIFEVDHSIVSGFQLATLTGPLCDEPMMGVCLVVEDIEFQEGEFNDFYGPLSGQMISAVKEGCRMAFQVKPQRLMEALYLCEIQVSSNALGKMYSVLGSRRAQILREGMKEGTPIFCIQARLPVVESFGFSQQSMIKTSGAASTQLFFDNYWEVMEQDPFFVPTTDEELEEHGSNVASIGNNIARQYVDQIRKRKGLLVEEKLVQHADKQRTLKKNK